jgi:hypothetical protein
MGENQSSLFEETKYLFRRMSFHLFKIFLHELGLDKYIDYELTI